MPFPKRRTFAKGLQAEPMSRREASTEAPVYPYAYAAKPAATAPAANMPREVLFRMPGCEKPGMYVKVTVPPGFDGGEKYRRVDELAPRVLEVADGWASIRDLMTPEGRVDDAALVAVLVAQTSCRSVDDLRSIESVGRALMHIANPKIYIPLADLDRKLVAEARGSASAAVI